MTIYYNTNEDGSISELTEIKQDRFEFETEEEIVEFNGKQWVLSEINKNEYKVYWNAKQKQARNLEIDQKIAELNEMCIPEIVNGNTENIELYKQVIEGLELARP